MYAPRSRASLFVLGARCVADAVSTEVGLMSRKGIFFAAAAAVCLLAGPAAGYERYGDGCDTCHGSFTGSTSPKGSVFPNSSNHDMHAGNSNMNTECDLCHTVGDNRNPKIGESNGTASNPGLGCTGCHVSPGLRARHALQGINSCGLCHAGDPAPAAESVPPPYYGTVDTAADNSCNAEALSKTNENWTVGDLVGLDNDGDGLFDASDPDCAIVPPGVRTVLLRRVDDSRWFHYELAGYQVVDKGFLVMTRSLDYSVVSRADFDGDGQGDVLLRDFTGNQNNRWVMYTLAGGVLTGGGFVDLTRNQDWVIQSVADFDADGRGDVLLRNRVTGAWFVYLLDGLTIKDKGQLAMTADLDEGFVGAADFDGNGTADVLLRRPDGSWKIYLLAGLTAPDDGQPAMTTNTAFQVQALADFGGDGRADVLLRRTDGRWFMYEMNGTQVFDSGNVPMVENPAFGFVTAADFSGDGRSDVLLRRTDGRWFMYLLDGYVVLDSASPPLTKNVEFGLVEAADYDGDDKADLLMRRSDGRWVVYLMDGTAVLDQGPPDMTRNVLWEPLVD